MRPALQYGLHNSPLVGPHCAESPASWQMFTNLTDFLPLVLQALEAAAKAQGKSLDQFLTDAAKPQAVAK